jgi:lysophospholipid hydrolase
VLEKGYQAALKILEKFEEEGKLPSAFIDGKDRSHTEKKKGKSARRNSI